MRLGVGKHECGSQALGGPQCPPPPGIDIYVQSLPMLCQDRCLGPREHGRSNGVSRLGLGLNDSADWGKPAAVSQAALGRGPPGGEPRSPTTAI